MAQKHLLNGLGFNNHKIDVLLRKCEIGRIGRRAACSLFWTLGGNQVGKGAIAGWRDLLGPALRWIPFRWVSGRLRRSSGRDS